MPMVSSFSYIIFSEHVVVLPQIISRNIY